MAEHIVLAAMFLSLRDPGVLPRCCTALLDLFVPQGGHVAAVTSAHVYERPSWSWQNCILMSELSQNLMLTLDLRQVAELAAKFEQRLQQGSKPIFHLEVGFSAAFLCFRSRLCASSRQGCQFAKGCGAHHCVMTPMPDEHGH